MAVSSISCFALNTHPRTQMSVGLFPPIKLSSSIAIRCGKMILKQLYSSYWAASLSQSTGESWTGSVRGVAGGESDSAVHPSAMCAISSALALGTCWSWRRVYLTSIPILYIFLNEVLVSFLAKDPNVSFGCSSWQFCPLRESLNSLKQSWDLLS